MANPSTTALPDGIVSAISREDLLELPIRRYSGEVCLVETLADLERALADLREADVVGFDTETRPAFVKGQSFPPCLAQVATARAVYLFSLRRPDFFHVLGELLTVPRTVKVGIGLARDLRELKRLFPFVERNVLDLGSIARRYGLEQTGLRNLAAIFLGCRIPKGPSTSNWAAARLSAAQITYAATDAWVCRELFLCMQALGMLAQGTISSPA